MQFRSKLDWAFLGKLLETARERQISIVQSHSLKPHLVALWLSRKLGIPWVAFAHGWTAETRRVHAYNFVEKRILRLPDHLITVTEQIAESLRVVGRRKPTHVIPNTIERVDPTPEQIDAAKTLRTRCAADPKTVVFCTVGRLSAEKAPDLLIRALGDRQLASTDWKCLIAGDGPMRAALEQLSAELGIQDRVEFLGHVPDATPVMLAADVYCSPSHSEGVPNVILEAANLKMPIVATRVGAITEILKDHEAMLVDAGDLKGLKAALRSVAASGELRQSLANASRCALDRWLSPRERAEMILDVYRQTVCEASAMAAQPAEQG